MLIVYFFYLFDDWDHTGFVVFYYSCYASHIYSFSHATRLAELNDALRQVEVSADAINDRVRSAEDVKLLVDTDKIINGADLLAEPFRRVLKYVWRTI